MQQSQKSRGASTPVPPRGSPATAAAKLKCLTDLRPTLAMILGSGLQHIVEALHKNSSISYSRLPGFTNTSIVGHAGQAHIGILGNTPVLMLAGRLHYYEGHSMADVTWPVRVLGAYGIRDVLVTNAAGGLNPHWHPGDFMRITDHINLMGANPLHGPASHGLSRFVDLSHVYDPKLCKFLAQAASSCRMKLRSGVYLAVSGPSYETPAEIRAFARLGADAVGMSTVPEVIVARQLGIRVAGLSCITNLAAGLGSQPISHEEVLQVGLAVKEQSLRLLTSFALIYGKNGASL